MAVALTRLLPPLLARQYLHNTREYPIQTRRPFSRPRRSLRLRSLRTGRRQRPDDCLRAAEPVPHGAARLAERASHHYWLGHRGRRRCQSRGAPGSRPALSARAGTSLAGSSARLPPWWRQQEPAFRLAEEPR